VPLPRTNFICSGPQHHRIAQEPAHHVDKGWVAPSGPDGGEIAYLPNEEPGEQEAKTESQLRSDTQSARATRRLSADRRPSRLKPRLCRACGFADQRRHWRFQRYSRVANGHCQTSCAGSRDESSSDAGQAAWLSQARKPWPAVTERSAGDQAERGDRSGSPRACSFGSQLSENYEMLHFTIESTRLHALSTPLRDVAESAI